MSEQKKFPFMCETCIFWNPDETGEQGDCYSEPPKVLVIENSLAQSRPVTLKNDTCRCHHTSDLECSCEDMKND